MFAKSTRFGNVYSLDFLSARLLMFPEISLFAMEPESSMYETTVSEIDVAGLLQEFLGQHRSEFEAEAEIFEKTNKKRLVIKKAQDMNFSHKMNG